MTLVKRAVCIVGLVALAIALVIVSPHAAAAQSDPHVGTWILNVAKSNYTPGPAPKAQTSVYAAAGDGMKVTTSGTSADGKPTKGEFSIVFDGKDHPATGNPDWDTVQTGTSAVSKDGKTRTVTMTGVNAQGQKVKTVGVYEKK